MVLILVFDFATVYLVVTVICVFKVVRVIWCYKWLTNFQIFFQTFLYVKSLVVSVSEFIGNPILTFEIYKVIFYAGDPLIIQEYCPIPIYLFVF